MPLRDHTFDTVLFVWSLHHIADPLAAWREAARVVRAEGRVIAVSARPEPPIDDEIGHALHEIERAGWPGRGGRRRPSGARRAARSRGRCRRARVRTIARTNRRS